MAYTLPHPSISEIPNTEPAAEPNLWNTRYQEIDENFERISGFNPVAQCTTAAATAAKTANCQYFVLTVDSFIVVRFTVTNTAANPTLNVNNTGAKPIKYRNAPVKASQLAANRAYLMVYDGTNWVIVGDLDIENVYLKLTGGTVTGAVAFNGTVTVKDPTAGKHPVTKDYLGNQITQLQNDYLPKAGGTITGNLTINGTTTVKDPTQPQHPVTKAFFDKEMQDLDSKIGFDDLKSTADGIYQAFVDFNENNGVE